VGVAAVDRVNNVRNGVLELGRKTAKERRACDGTRKKE
jgi:hypothetical protein